MHLNLIYNNLNGEITDVFFTKKKIPHNKNILQVHIWITVDLEHTRHFTPTKQRLEVCGVNNLSKYVNELNVKNTVTVLSLNVAWRCKSFAIKSRSIMHVCFAFHQTTSLPPPPDVATTPKRTRS